MSAYGIDALERALRLLDTFDGEGQRFELRELAARTGFTKPMILRITASLERFGHLVRDGEGRYALGPSLWRLGILYRRGLSLETAVRPVLAELVAITGETAAFYRPSGDRRVCLYRHNSPRRARHHVEEGDALPLDAGSGGHLIRAFSGARGERYDRIRADGYCVSIGERDPEVSGIAAPVFGPDDALVGALLLSGLRARLDEASVMSFVPQVVAAAARLSAAVAGRTAREAA